MIQSGHKSVSMVPFMKRGHITNPLEENHLFHTHGGGHGHTHEVMTNPGYYHDRDMPILRSDWKRRAFTVGIGGPVGSGKTALVLKLCLQLRDEVELAVITNDIFTREDWEFLVKHQAIPEERLEAVRKVLKSSIKIETGGCPHAAIREDISLNIEAVKRLTKKFNPQIIMVESGGDNLAANFSRDLADFIIYVIDVAGGDKIPRKGGPGITQSDLLIINKIDLAEAVGANLEIMENEGKEIRQNGPIIMAEIKNNKGVSEIAQFILKAYINHTKDESISRLIKNQKI